MRNCLRKRGRLESGGFNVKQRVLRFFCGQRSEAAPRVWRSIGRGWAINGSLRWGAPLRGREASGDASGNLGCFGCERNRLTDSHLKDSLAARSGAGTPAGVPEAAGLDSGGIAALNHRLQAGIPPG